MRISNFQFPIECLSKSIQGEDSYGIWNGKDLSGKEVQSGVYFLKAKGYKPVKVVKLR